MGSPQTSSEPRSPTVYPVSPEVQQILQQQDDQLKALQRQIQKLLHAHENRQTMASPQKSIKTQTVTTRSATVNTGASLLNFNSYVHQVCRSLQSLKPPGLNKTQTKTLLKHSRQLIYLFMMQRSICYFLSLLCDTKAMISRVVG